jgi:hypothetical protein
MGDGKVMVMVVVSVMVGLAAKVMVMVLSVMFVGRLGKQIKKKLAPRLLLFDYLLNPLIIFSCYLIVDHFDVLIPLFYVHELAPILPLTVDVSFNCLLNRTL